MNLKHEEEKLSTVLEREEKDIKRLMEVINMIDRYVCVCPKQVTKGSMR